MSRVNIFLDSGAHSLYIFNVLKGKAVESIPLQGDEARARAKEMAEMRRQLTLQGGYNLARASVTGRHTASKEGFKYFYENVFWEYLDSYGKFLQRFGSLIEKCVNMDVIFNPEQTWKAQKYIEDNYGVEPIPVIHWGTPYSWIEKYVKEGYEYLGIGGLGQEVHVNRYTDWADGVFEMLKGTNIKTHGFAMTSYPMILRYPWTSVDSTTYTLMAGYGKILIPHLRNGEFDFTPTPYILKVSSMKGKKKYVGRNPTYHLLRGNEKKVVDQWMEYIGEKIGDDNEEGVSNSHYRRCVANIQFFLAFQKWLEGRERQFVPRERFGFV